MSTALARTTTASNYRAIIRRRLLPPAGPAVSPNAANSRRVDLSPGGQVGLIYGAICAVYGAHRVWRHGLRSIPSTRYSLVVWIPGLSSFLVFTTKKK